MTDQPQEFLWQDEIQESEHNLYDSNDHEKKLEFHGSAFSINGVADTKGAHNAAQEGTILIATYRNDSHGAPSTNTTCSGECPVRATAEIVEHKWATLIVRELLSGKKRFSALERSLVSISPKILSERLRELEAKQIVSRTVFPTVPPTTEYELTLLGRELEMVIRAMQQFGILLLETNRTTAEIQDERP